MVRCVLVIADIIAIFPYRFQPLNRSRVLLSPQIRVRFPRAWRPTPRLSRSMQHAPRKAIRMALRACPLVATRR